MASCGPYTGPGGRLAERVAINKRRDASVSLFFSSLLLLVVFLGTINMCHTLLDTSCCKLRQRRPKRLPVLRVKAWRRCLSCLPQKILYSIYASMSTYIHIYLCACGVRVRCLPIRQTCARFNIYAREIESALLSGGRKQTPQPPLILHPHRAE